MTPGPGARPPAADDVVIMPLCSPRAVRRIGIVVVLVLVGAWWWGWAPTGSGPASPVPAVPVASAGPSAAPTDMAAFPAPADSLDTVAVPAGTASVTGAVETELRFTNQTADYVAVFWIDYGGQPVRYHLLEPGHSVVQQTYLTHLWIGKGEDGTVYPVVVADGTPGREVVFRRVDASPAPGSSAPGFNRF